MATLQQNGTITVQCPGCEGSKSTYEWLRSEEKGDHGAVGHKVVGRAGDFIRFAYRLFRCAGCGRGGIATLHLRDNAVLSDYPNGVVALVSFYPEVIARLKLPEAVPDGIQAEFREAERCMGAGCLRAAAGLFRSVLDKTMRANGYKKVGNLQQQIDAAASDGAITESRKRRAHDEIRVLGNDVLHDEWQPVASEDVEPAHHYAQRILEDFYDDRATTLTLLRSKNRVPDEDKPANPT
jgi:hypothetical protein